MDLEDFFMTLVEEEYDMRDSEGDSEEWVKNFHNTEYDTADYCTEFLDNYNFHNFPPLLKNAILGSVCWEKVWKYLHNYIKEQKENA